MLSDEEFLTRFEDLSLPAEAFSHRGHLRLAWLYLQRLPALEAMERITSGIPAYASSLGAADKYHHTLTVAIVRVMAERGRQSPGLSFEDFLNANNDLVEDFRGLLLTHYSEARLFSEEARLAWLEPDLAPLPELTLKASNVDYRQAG